MSLRSFVYGCVAGGGIYYYYGKSALGERSRIIESEIHSIQASLPEASHLNPKYTKKNEASKHRYVKEHEYYTKLRTTWNGMLFKGRDYVTSLFSDE